MSYVSQSEYVGGEDDGVLEARILTTLFGRWADDHPGQTLTIHRAEFEAYAEREIMLNVGIAMEQDENIIRVRYQDRDEARRELDREKADRIAAVVRAACRAVIDDPRALPEHREAAQHTLAAMDALVPQRGPGEAVSDPGGVGERPQDDPAVFARSARDDDERYDEGDPTANA